jgi:hypothetical protein
VTEQAEALGIDECLEKVKSTFSEQVKTLLNPKFQLFENPQA